MSTVAFRVISITRKDNAPAKKKRVHFAPMIVTVRTIYQSKLLDNRATYPLVSILRYFSVCQRIVPTDAPFVPPRDEQGGPELVEEPAAEILIPPAKGSSKSDFDHAAKTMPLQKRRGFILLL